MKDKLIQGVIAAALTPLNNDFRIDLDAFLPYLDFLAEKDCHGALLFGTTGEGTSFAPDERIEAFGEVVKITQRHPNFCLLAGTGTPSLEETVLLTKAAFDRGFDGVVVLPPYYYRNASEDGLYAWYSEVLRRAVPADGALYGYHFPAMSGVSLPINLLIRLKRAFPDSFHGIKNSTYDADFARMLGRIPGKELAIFSGDDRLFSISLQAGANGCIAASASLLAPELRRLWDSFEQGIEDTQTQEHLSRAREVVLRYPPAPPLIKALLSQMFGFPFWPVRLPLLPLQREVIDQVQKEFEGALEGASAF